MQAILIGYINQFAIRSVFSILLMMAVCFTSIPTVFAQDKDLPPETQIDILMNTAKNDMHEERWNEAVQGFEKVLKLGVNPPGEFHFYYGKALLKTDNFDNALFSLTNYLTLAGKDGEYFEDTITLIVEAKNNLDDVKQRSEEPQQQITDAAEETEDGMVFIKGGCFDRGDIFDDGSSDEKPVHVVCVGDFYLGKTEVTQKQWVKIMGHNPSKFQCDDCPVERVSWYDVQDFIKKLNDTTGMNYRIPTEAEWEYAARSGGGKEEWAGTVNRVKIGEYAWYCSNSGDSTHAVAGKKPNGSGLYDMMGNVWEWCSDWYNKEYYLHSTSKDPKGPMHGSHRVLRGGGWRSNANALRSTDRNNFNPGSKKFSDIGFRLARSP